MRSDDSRVGLGKKMKLSELEAVLTTLPVSQQVLIEASVDVLTSRIRNMGRKSALELLFVVGGFLADADHPPKFRR